MATIQNSPAARAAASMASCHKQRRHIRHRCKTTASSNINHSNCNWNTSYKLLFCELLDFVSKTIYLILKQQLMLQRTAFPQWRYLRDTPTKTQYTTIRLHIQAPNYSPCTPPINIQAPHYFISALHMINTPPHTRASLLPSPCTPRAHSHQ